MHAEQFVLLKLASYIIIGIVSITAIVSFAIAYNNKQFANNGYIECPLRGANSSVWTKPGECQ